MNEKLIDSSRTQLRVRLEMLETFRDNYQSKYRKEARRTGTLASYVVTVA